MKKPVYLDYNATTPVDPLVIEALVPVMREHFGNAASKTHAHGWHAEELVQVAREKTAKLINAGTRDVIFTSGATEACNLAIKGLFFGGHIKVGDEIVTATTEHKAVLEPIHWLEKQGVKIKILPVDKEGNLSAESLAAALNDKTRLVSLMLANNEIGTLSPIQKFSALCRKYPQILFHCDATQAVGKIPVDVKALDVDLLNLSAHKFYGPKGVGALFVRPEIKHSKLAPLIHGGTHEDGLRAGTLNTPGIVGLGKAAELAAARMSADNVQISKLSAELLAQIENKIPAAILNGPRKNRLSGNINLFFPGTDSATLLGSISHQLSLSASSACTSGSQSPSHVLAAIGLDVAAQRASVRIGIGRTTTQEEITFAAEVLEKAVKELAR